MRSTAVANGIRGYTNEVRLSRTHCRSWRLVRGGALCLYSCGF
ncbi:hypothetical protein ACQ4M3_06890 [Leptolyngbya sp. AN03gr2]